ncbi:MAG TPA: regulatory protein RecX [bacterium]|nr:regulatory protein RecX [bacterium]
MPIVVSIRGGGRISGAAGPSGGAWGGDRRVVVLDDGRALRVDAEELARRGIASGETIPGDVAEQLEARGLYVRARDLAIRLLSPRPRSVSELRLKLRQRGIPDAQIRAVIDDLTRIGHLDDLAFARGWVAARLGRRPCGAPRLRRELREKGVATALVEQAIREAYGEEDPSVAEERYARALVGRRQRVYRHLSPDVRTRRLAGLLQRQGFSTRTIIRVLRGVGRRGVTGDVDE